jgi:hypothetical protein
MGNSLLTFPYPVKSQNHITMMKTTKLHQFSEKCSAIFNSDATISKMYITWLK